MTAADLCDPAYVASVIASRAVIEEAAPGIFDRYAEGCMDDGSLPVPALREFEEAVERLRTYSPDLTINSLLHTPAKGLRKLQAKLAAPKAKYRQAEVELRVIAEGAMAHAIYLSGSTKEAGAWVEAMPKTAALTMSATVFACAARNRLLIPHPFILAGTTCPCRSEVIDVYRVHAQKYPLKEIPTPYLFKHMTAFAKLSGNSTDTWATTSKWSSRMFCDSISHSTGANQVTSAYYALANLCM